MGNALLNHIIDRGKERVDLYETYREELAALLDDEALGRAYYVKEEHQTYGRMMIKHKTPVINV